MSTILTQGKRRCDGVCHTAIKTKCACICGGRYHGSIARKDIALQAEMTELAQGRVTKAEPVAVIDDQQPGFEFGL